MRLILFFHTQYLPPASFLPLPSSLPSLQFQRLTLSEAILHYIHYIWTLLHSVQINTTLRHVTNFLRRWLLNIHSFVIILCAKLQLPEIALLQYSFRTKLIYLHAPLLWKVRRLNQIFLWAYVQSELFYSKVIKLLTKLVTCFSNICMISSKYRIRNVSLFFNKESRISDS